MNNNIELQIEMICNKIARLEIQKEFYEKILSTRETKDSNKN